jgi:hypothetical protein
VPHWSERADINGDVVFFSSIQSEIEKSATEILVWDLDKTYLDTAIDSLSGLFRAVMERALTKKNIPGTDTLLRTLADEQEKETGRGVFPIYFITASPPQMEERIAEKFAFDRIRPFGCFYKDNLKNLRPGRFWRLTKQVGYKLQALMQLRLRLAENVKQICFGDDSESDVLIYNLYSDICARRISAAEIRSVLAQFSVSGEQVDVILNLQSQIPQQDPLEKVYINLATDTDPEYYLKYGRRTLATTNSYQVALDLYQDHRLSFEGLCDVADDMIENYGFSADELTQSLDELFKRSILSKNTWEKLAPQLLARGLVYKGYQPSVPLLGEVEAINGRVYRLEGEHEPWFMERIEY